MRPGRASIFGSGNERPFGFARRSRRTKIMGVALSDYVTGFSAAYGILGGLLARQTSGQGLKVETSLLQATLSFIGETAAGYFATGTVPTRIARVKNGHAFAFGTRDNLPLAIHCSVPEKFGSRSKAADRMDITEDARFKTRDDRRRNFEQLEKELAPTFVTKDRQQWLRLLDENDVPASPLYNMKEVLGDRQIVHLGLERRKWSTPIRARRSSSEVRCASKVCPRKNPGCSHFPANTRIQSLRNSAIAGKILKTLENRRHSPLLRSRMVQSKNPSKERPLNDSENPIARGNQLLSPIWAH